MAYRVDKRSSCSRLRRLLLGLTLMPAVATAQQTIVPLQLSFSDPGARSMGFGGAFVALADDATAAFSNPAGLVQLLRPEISVEARSWDYSTPYTVAGRVEGAPSGFGIDSTAGITSGTADYQTTGLSFVSLAFPSDRWSLAAYRHVYANLEFEGKTQGLFGGGSSCCQTRYADQIMSSNFDVVTYAVSGAYRVSDRIDLGLGLVYSDASMDAYTSQYRWDDDTWEAFIAPNSFLPSRREAQEHLFIDDSDWSLAAGFLWRASDSWRIGGVYRQGAEFTIGSETTAGELNNFGAPADTVVFRATGIPIEFPDIYGLGLAYRNRDGNLTLSFQWDRIEYSDIPKSLGLDDLTIDDADELHLGAEYVFLDATPIIAVRLGAWLEPDHQMHATIDDPYLWAMQPRGDDEFHYSAGLGMASEHFQVDVALDFADRLDTYSLSVIYNF